MTESTGLSRRALLSRAAAAAVALAGGRGAAAAGAVGWPAASAYRSTVATAWFDLALELARTTPGFSPPVSSRAFAYAGVALYEALVPGLPGRASLAGSVGGLTPPPLPADAACHWPTVASSALATILRALFPTASAENVAATARLERSFAGAGYATLPYRVFRRSVARGVGVARHVFAWSAADGGHEAFRAGLPPYTAPAGPGFWEPTPPAFAPALQPFWGRNRPFTLAVDPPDRPPDYSEDAASAFYAEAYECYRAVRELTPERTAIARFWADEPGTVTPPGHSLSLATQAVRARGARLDTAAEAYAKVGIAVADAFVCCWQTKFRLNVLRPVTYIRRLIDPTWSPLLVTPPFPEFTSGHSVQSGAAAQVLGELFGPGAFTDHTHDARDLAPRSFPFFRAAAEEAAVSRLYAGIHFRSAIDQGLEQGRRIGLHVARSAAASVELDETDRCGVAFAPGNARGRLAPAPP